MVRNIEFDLPELDQSPPILVQCTVLAREADEGQVQNWVATGRAHGHCDDQ